MKIGMNHSEEPCKGLWRQGIELMVMVQQINRTEATTYHLMG